MRFPIDIAGELYRKLLAKAAKEKRSVEELILRSAEAGLRFRQTKKGPRTTFPIIRSKHPGTLRIDNEKIYEFISFP